MSNIRKTSRTIIRWTHHTCDIYCATPDYPPTNRYSRKMLPTEIINERTRRCFPSQVSCLTKGRYGLWFNRWNVNNWCVYATRQLKQLGINCWLYSPTGFAEFSMWYLQCQVVLDCYICAMSLYWLGSRCQNRGSFWLPVRHIHLCREVKGERPFISS